MALNNAHFLAASRTATASTTDLVDFENLLFDIAARWGVDGDDEDILWGIIDDLELWGPNRAAWVNAFEEYLVSVEVQLLSALAEDGLPADLERKVLMLEVVDGVFATISNTLADVDVNVDRTDLAFTMARLLKPDIGVSGIIRDAQDEFQHEERYRPNLWGAPRPVGFHWLGRAAEDREEGWPADQICRCRECGRPRAKP